MAAAAKAWYVGAGAGAGAWGRLAAINVSIRVCPCWIRSEIWFMMGVRALAITPAGSDAIAEVWGAVSP